MLLVSVWTLIDSKSEFRKTKKKKSFYFVFIVFVIVEINNIFAIFFYISYHSVKLEATI